MIVIMKEQPYAIILGIALGILVILIGPSLQSLATEMYDDAHPVVKMEGKLISKNDDYYVVNIKGEKVRGEECQAVKIYGFLQNKGSQFNQDVIVERQDTNLKPILRPPGKYDLGNWIVSPANPEAEHLHIYVHHFCNERSIVTEMANVSLK